MSSVRLFILGALAKSGPMHGHQIRRNAQVDRTELWSDVRVGSLYGALGRMAAEGVIEAVRVEQEGNLPARTVYAITDEGRLELSTLRAALLRDTRLRADPVDLALQTSQDMPRAELFGAIEDRRAALEAELRSWRHLLETAAPFLTGIEPLGFQHRLMRLETELAWHDLVLRDLPKLLPDNEQKDIIE
ncbi:MAG TPA: PadR family transcriptional regulator [Pseudonocardiaceae bacterium]|jgi:DNA-binding PadR family transcriptional regulator|nr:PadR family transcriptional regulator [Pseudonocardiaceae bacterium]